ncbi:penicillin-binding protein 2 [Candidatus Pelagibacter communis]|uniref:penicillin-binding protein 2 n=1 Tax=Pelagibacter ubique TaxID=198252 RepID=UPI00065B3D54|nr:penicillin-binding protein 2 [Candidatus Pelagibacter ubique]
MISGNSGIRKTDVINRRMFIIGAAKIIIFTGIIARLFSLQVNENKKYLTLSDKNRIREWKLPPIRGDIVDYFGNVIAGNLKVYQLHIIPEQVENFNYLLTRLKTLLNLSDKKIEKIVKSKNKLKPWESIIVSENLSWSDFLKINNYLYDLVGVKPVMTISRNYPFSETYTHILGYVSQPNEEEILANETVQERFVPGMKIGKLGLEKTLENYLIGTNAIQRYEVNAYGKRINQLEHQKGKQGLRVRLTVDTEVQKACGKLLNDRAGSISVMDIYTGDIIAMYSSPSYDPNKFLFGISNDDWSLIRNNPLKPLVNKTLAGLYSPGSTIKPIVALSALENKIVSPSFKVKCTGKMELYGQTFHCWKEKGHGFVSLKNAMKQSCDTYFYEVARLLGVDRLNITAEKFGLGKKVLGDYFDFEKPGLFPNTKWKKNNLGKGWVLGETLITGIGQGYTQTTPLQLCLMTAQIANGGYSIKPRIIVDNNTVSFEEAKNKFEEESLFSEEKQLFENPKNIKIVQEAMFSSTNELYGTSYKSRIDDPKYQFAGKTGTAQVKRISMRERELDLKIEQIPYKDRDHALFVAYGPYINPRYALSIIVEHGGSGSKTAAPIAKELFKLIIDRNDLRNKQKNFEEIEI